jgi:hypothetical protein
MLGFSFDLRIHKNVRNGKAEVREAAIPSTMGCFPKLTTGELRKREGSRPPPMMIFDGFNPLSAEFLDNHSAFFIIL